MTLRRFVISSILVSISFAIAAYSLIAENPFGSPELRRAIMSPWALVFLPYFIGAMINKEGYWVRTESLSEWLGPSKNKKQVPWRIVRVILAVGLLALLWFVRRTWGVEVTKRLDLVLLGLAWGAVITRAWFIHKAQPPQVAPGTVFHTWEVYLVAAGLLFVPGILMAAIGMTIILDNLSDPHRSTEVAGYYFMLPGVAFLAIAVAIINYGRRVRNNSKP